MDTHCRIYRIDREVGVTKDKAVLEWNRGCNGTDHVDLLIKVWFLNGQVDFAEIVAEVERGCCDGLCTAGRLGGFIHSFSGHFESA